jgi:hypothetical protein
MKCLPDCNPLFWKKKYDLKEDKHPLQTIKTRLVETSN